MIFCNPDMVTNIQQTDEELTLTTNAGVLQTNMKANVPGWGEVWFNLTAMMNIFSYAQMVNRYPVTYDSKKEDAFIVHLLHKQVYLLHYRDQVPFIYSTVTNTTTGACLVHVLGTVAI
jgi:hypothetical protein